MQPNRTRHTATYLLSRFLMSEKSLALDLSPSMISVLRYMFDVMDMNFNQFGKEIFDKSQVQLATYSRVSRRMIQYFIAYLIDKKLIKIIRRKERYKAIYGVGELIKSGATIAPDYPQADLENEKSGATIAPALAQPLRQSGATIAPVVRNNFCKTERPPKKRAPLSENFLIDQKTKAHIRSLNLSPEDAERIGESFIEYFLDKGEERSDWQFECRRWFDRERNTTFKKPIAPTPQRETRSPDHLSWKGCEKETTKKFTEQILKNLKGKGGLSNGFLGTVGKTTKTD